MVAVGLGFQLHDAKQQQQQQQQQQQEERLACWLRPTEIKQNFSSV